MSIYYETAPHLIAASMALSSLDVLAVMLKFWARWTQKQPFKADDWLLVPATILTVAIGVMLTYGAAEEALGKPIEIPPDFTGDPSKLASAQQEMARKIQFAFLVMHPLAVGFTKLSFLFLYQRIFAIKRFAKLFVGAVCVVTAWMISFFFAEMFQCRTTWAANWSSTHDIANKCNETLWIIFGYCLSGFLLDLAILIIPIPLVWQLKLTTAKKLGVISIFLLGSGTVIASLLRFAFLATPIYQNPPYDKRFITLTTSLYWGMVEAGVGVFVACLATLQLQVRQLIWDMKTSNTTAGTLGSHGRSHPHYFGSGSGSRQARNTKSPNVDAPYDGNPFDGKDSHPILTRTETWVHGNRSETGSNDIELQTGPKPGPTETRDAY